MIDEFKYIILKYDEYFYCHNKPGLSEVADDRLREGQTATILYSELLSVVYYNVTALTSSVL